jgi:hypothetical protein
LKISASGSKALKNARRWRDRRADSPEIIEPILKKDARVTGCFPNYRDLK